jgi:hypothetical protein
METPMLNFLTKLRPKTDTAASIAQAITDLDSEAARLDGEIAALQAQRGDALLEGGKQAERLENDLRARRDDRERLDALRPALRRRLDEATRREQADRLRAMAAEATAARDAFARFLADEYPTLAARIVEGLRLEEAARKAVAAAMNAAQEAAFAESLPPDVVTPQMPTMAGGLINGLGPSVSLPNPTGGNFWPAPHAPADWNPDVALPERFLAASGIGA